MCWSRFVCGDVGYATSGIMDEAESSGMHYLFKQAHPTPVNERFLRLFARDGWCDAEDDWEGHFASRKLSGWWLVPRPPMPLSELFQPPQA